MERSAIDRIQYLIEQALILLIILGMFAVILYHFTFMGIFIGLVFAYLLSSFSFWLLKSKGKWFKHKNYVPKAVNIFFAILNFAAFSLYHEGRTSRYVSVAILLTMILSNSLINYYFNFKSPKPGL